MPLPIKMLNMHRCQNWVWNKRATRLVPVMTQSPVIMLAFLDIHPLPIKKADTREKTIENRLGSVIAVWITERGYCVKTSELIFAIPGVSANCTICMSDAAMIVMKRTLLCLDIFAMKPS